MACSQPARHGSLVTRIQTQLLELAAGDPGFQDLSSYPQPQQPMALSLFLAWEAVLSPGSFVAWLLTLERVERLSQGWVGQLWEGPSQLRPAGGCAGPQGYQHSFPEKPSFSRLFPQEKAPRHGKPSVSDLESRVRKGGQNFPSSQKHYFRARFC